MKSLIPMRAFTIIIKYLVFLWTEISIRVSLTMMCDDVSHKPTRFHSSNLLRKTLSQSEKSARGSPKTYYWWLLCCRGVFFSFFFKIKIPDLYWRQAEAVWRISSITTGWKSLSSAESLLSAALLHPLSSAHPSLAHTPPPRPRTLSYKLHTSRHQTTADALHQFCIKCQKEKPRNVYPADNSSTTIWQLDEFIDPPVGGGRLSTAGTKTSDKRTQWRNSKTKQ